MTDKERAEEVAAGLRKVYEVDALVMVDDTGYWIAVTGDSSAPIPSMVNGIWVKRIVK